MTETELKALKEYIEVETEWAKVYSNFWDLDEQGKKEVREQSNKLSHRMNELEPLFKYIKIQIKNPSKIVGARVSTAYGGKVDVFDCNDLVHLHLSDSRETGIVKMPYEFDVDGNAYRVDHAHEFHVKREGKKVYLIDPLNRNTCTRWYNYIKF